MTREEKSKRIYFIQMSQDFFDEIPVKRLLMTSAGDTMLRIYLQLWCKSLKDGGTLTLTGEMPLAEELAMILGIKPVTAEQWKAELRMVETAVRCCTDYGLISVDGDVVDFVQTEQYTKKYTKETVESWNNSNDNDEKPEKAPSNRAKAQAEADAMFERLWRKYPKKKDKARVKPSTRYKLYKDFGEERCQAAVDRYIRECEGKDPQYILNGLNFFNSRIFDYLDGDAQTAQPTRPMTAKQTESLGMSLGIFNSGRWNRDAYMSIRDSLTDAQRQAIDSVIN